MNQSMNHTAWHYKHGGWLLLAGLIALFGPSVPAQGKFPQDRQPPSGESKNAVRIPDLGANPWAIDSILGARRGLQGGLEGMSVDRQKELLKNFWEKHKGSLTSNEKKMVESLMNRAGNGKNVDRENLKRMFEQFFPEGKSAASEELKKLLGSGGFDLGDPASALEPNKFGEKGEPGGNSPTPPAVPQLGYAGGPGGLGKGPDQETGPMAQPGTSQELGPKLPGNKPLPAPPFAKGAGGVTPPSDLTPPAGTDKAVKSLLPLGLDKWAKPAAKSVMEWGVKWSKDLKLPKGWGDEIKKSISQLKLPAAGSMPSAPRLPTVPSMSLPRPEALVVFVMGGLGVAVMIWLMLKKMGIGSPGGLLGAFRSKAKGDDLIAALENAVLRLGGDQGALGNHILWKNDYAPVMAQKGLAPDAIDRIFDQYVWMKYRGLPLDREAQSQAIAALHRI